MTCGRMDLIFNVPNCYSFHTRYSLLELNPFIRLPSYLFACHPIGKRLWHHALGETICRHLLSRVVVPSVGKWSVSKGSPTSSPRSLQICCLTPLRSIASLLSQYKDLSGSLSPLNSGSPVKKSSILLLSIASIYHPRPSRPGG